MNKILWGLLFLITIPLTGVFAYTSSFDLGGQNNPIYVKEIVSPYQSMMDDNQKQAEKNSAKQTQLKTQYGVSAYYSCSAKSQSACGSNVDMGNAYNMTTCLSFIEYCLESAEIKKKHAQEYQDACITKYGINGALASVDDINKTYTCGCKSGYVLNTSKTSCVSNTPTKTLNDIYNDVCKQSFGIWSLYTGNADKTQGGNMGGCSCLNGYGWNNDMSACIIESQATNDLLCSNGFGPTSKWSGNKNAAGQPSCTCKDGYILTNNKCIIAPVKTNNQICIDAYGINSFYLETDKINNKITCDCKQGFQWNVDKTRCIVSPKIEQTVKQDKEIIKAVQAEAISNSLQSTSTPTSNIIEKTARKGFWSRVKGWFGF